MNEKDNEKFLELSEFSGEVKKKKRRRCMCVCVAGGDGEVGFSRKKTISPGIWAAWTKTQWWWSIEQMLEGIRKAS